VGHFRVGMMQRYARPLCLAPFLQERVRPLSAARAAAVLSDPLFRLLDAEKRTSRRYETHCEDASGMDERFDELFDRSASRTGIVGVRDSRYLQWRYAANPLYRSEVVRAEQHGRLAGYLVFTEEDGALVVKDIFPGTDATVTADLLAAVTRIGRERHLRSATFTVMCGHPCEPALARFGYRPRAEQSQVFAYAAAGELKMKVQAPHSWQIAAGDRDV
jgi:hypothetical protein